MRIFLPEQTFETTSLREAMHQVRQKRPGLKLSLAEYKLLHHRVLERDRWHCQDCGSSKDLHVHHLKKRSNLGDDALDNLITVCAVCHKRRHGS